MVPRYKSRSVRKGWGSRRHEVAWGKNVIAGCVPPCAILVKRLEKRANGLISFRRFARLSRALLCPAPQSLTLIAREKLGWITPPPYLSK